MTKHILLVGNSTDLSPFLGYFATEGVAVTEIDHTGEAYARTLELQPDGIVFVTPRYWDDVTRFVDKIRAEAGFERTPIVYIGSLIEGEDQRILKQKGVHTLTLGPVPHAEMVRFIVHLLGG